MAVAALTCGSCEGGSRLTCPDSFNMQYTVSRFAYIDTQDNSLTLKCDYSTVALNFSMMDGCSFPNVIYVKIEQCPLFNDSIASVITKLGVNATNVQFLWWELSHSVENGPQTWHLDGLRNLTELQIQSNEFKSFPNKFLENTPLLNKLYITGNILSELPSDFLSYTPEITFLDLGNNKLESISENFLHNVPSLEMLNLWVNQLTTIPPKLFASTPLLGRIVLRDNRLESLDPTLFEGLDNLRNIDLQDNKLQSLPETIFQDCANLTHIYLQHNSIGYIPPNVFRNTSLILLNLGYNKLSNISGVLSSITTLQNVTLHMNEFQNLPGDMFFGTNNIVRLDLQANKIQSIGEGIFKRLSKMKVILLNSNALDRLPPALFRNCISLMRVFMQMNNLSSIPMDTFSDYSDITKLDLSFNRLTFENTTFYHPLNKLASLEEIYLSNNNISTIFAEVLYVFTRLRILDLRYNSISLLSDRELVFLSKNVTLLLQHNNITKIQATKYLGFGSSEKILSINLAGNPIKCDCTMHSFLKVAQFTPPFITNMPYNLLVNDAKETLCSESYASRTISLASVDASKVVCDFPCSLECPCSVRLEDSFIIMDCSNQGLYQSPTFTRKFNQARKHYKLSLDLSKNEYEDISFLSGVEFENLINLDLTNNTISEINETLLPEKLQYLDLRFNNFTAMSEKLVDHINASGITLHLGGNPWSCDCGLKSFHELIRNSYELVRQQLGNFSNFRNRK